jgi:pyruvate/2-oxoglutarate dehydrogenase complex dihydrolipoamide dehydrogenase (E3) component
MANASSDVVVLGAGAAGQNVADRVVLGGLTAGIVERGLVGGECSYRSVGAGTPRSVRS